MFAVANPWTQHGRVRGPRLLGRCQSPYCLLWCSPEIIDKYLSNFFAELCASSLGAIVNAWEGLLLLNMIDSWLGCHPNPGPVENAAAQIAKAVQSCGNWRPLLALGCKTKL